MVFLFPLDFFSKKIKKNGYDVHVAAEFTKYKYLKKLGIKT